MRFRKHEPFLSVLFDTGVHLIDSWRKRVPGSVEDIRDNVRDTYNTASGRASRASDALRGEEDSHMFGMAISLLIGVGIGVGVGLLIAPASGEETRADLADKVTDFGDKVRESTGNRQKSGTEGE
jgi:YtxH-like protein